MQLKERMKLTERKISINASRCPQLRYMLEDVESETGEEDTILEHVYQYTDDEIISEALYVLSLYYEDGHAFYEGKKEGRPEERKRCRNEIAQLKRFIKKHAEDFSPSIKEAILFSLECNGL